MSSYEVCLICAEGLIATAKRKALMKTIDRSCFINPFLEALFLEPTDSKLFKPIIIQINIGLLTLLSKDEPFEFDCLCDRARQSSILKSFL